MEKTRSAGIPAVSVSLPSSSALHRANTISQTCSICSSCSMCSICSWIRNVPSVPRRDNTFFEHSQHLWVLDISKLVTCANSILKFTDLFSWCQKMRTKNKANMSLHQFQLKVIVLPQNNTNPRLPEHHELSTITQKTNNPGPSLSWRLHGAGSQ